jgi:acyl-coenzyme A synthetase/AMP-(fatty) acid ligase
MAFGVESGKGKEYLVVVAETKLDDHDALRRQVHARASEAAGAPPHDIVLVGPGTLPKTSSGKLQRSLCRARYLDHALLPA